MMLALKTKDAAPSRIEVYEGISFADADALCEAARALVQRGPPFAISEGAVLGGAWPHLMHRPLRDHIDVLVAQVCPKFVTRSYTPARRTPTPFDDRIDEAEKLHDEATTRMRSVQGEMHRRDERITTLERTRPGIARDAQLHAARAEYENAAHAYRSADGEWLRTRARWTALQMARSRWRSEQD